MPAPRCRPFSVLAALALEIVAAGRVLPDLRRGADGYEASWEPLMNGADDERVRTVARLAPPGLPFPHRRGSRPEAIVHHAAERLRRCRVPGLRSPPSRPALIRLPRGGADPRPPALESWLTALASPSPAVVADPTSWPSWSASSANGAPTPPPGAGPGGSASASASRAERDRRTTDPRARTQRPPAAGRPTGRRGDLASWSSSCRPPTISAWSSRPKRSGGPATQLQRASRSLSAPHEVFLAELGRAVRIYPELGEALRQPAPTGLALDLDGAHRFLARRRAGARGGRVRRAPALVVGAALRPAWACGSRPPRRPPRPGAPAPAACSTRTASAPSTGRPPWATSRSTRPSCSGWPS